MSKPNVGFIGLGIMGAPMARNLIDAGYSLTVWNRSQAKIDAVAAHGATAAGSAAEVAANSSLTLRTSRTSSLAPMASLKGRRRVASWWT